MNVYLPIAEMSVNIFTILGLGWFAGLLAGLFGIGGGFLMTPFLIFLGVPPAVSVSSVANQVIASSATGFLSQWKRGNVDFKMGWFLIAGGMLGSTLGVSLFRWLKALGYIDLIISLSYVTFLGVVGALMVRDSLHTLMKLPKKNTETARVPLAKRLPLKVQFPYSKMEISAVMPLLIGFVVGIMASLMGISGGFFLIPALMYIVGMPTSTVIGTSLFQTIFITVNVTLLQAITTQTVDILLTLLLVAGSVPGMRVGTRLGNKLPAEHLRAWLAALVLGMAIKLAWGLFTPPTDIFSVSVME